MAEKTKLKWLRKEFSSSEELEYYLTQLKHQDKLKSDIVALLERFQHLLFQDYEPDFLTISYNGQWDVSFSNANFEDKQKAEPSNYLPAIKTEAVKPETPKPEAKKPTKVTTDQTVKSAKIEYKPASKPNREDTKKASKPVIKSNKTTKKTSKNKSGQERIDLNDLITANLLNVGTKLRYKNQSNVLGIVTREGTLRVGKDEYRSLSGAATSLATSGRRDGWLCWFFQDSNGEWKSVDLLRHRWKEHFGGQK